MAELELAADDELVVDELELDSLLLLDSFELLPESFEPEPEPEPPLELSPLELDEPPSEDDVEPLADFVDDRESVMYQPLPLKTMPTG